MNFPRSLTIRPLPQVSRYFLIRNFFISDTVSVYTHLANWASNSDNLILLRVTEKFLNLERNICRFEDIQIRVDAAKLETWSNMIIIICKLHKILIANYASDEFSSRVHFVRSKPSMLRLKLEDLWLRVLLRRSTKLCLS